MVCQEYKVLDRFLLEVKILTKEEAYNAMQEGLPVSHKDFREGEFLWMDDNFIIKDENGDEFETSWDVKTGDRWEADWYIYKNRSKVIKRAAIPFKRPEESYIEEKQFISHIYGKSCPGKGMCLQYSMASETACVICDCTDNERMIDTTIDPLKLLESNLDENTTYTEVIETPEIEHKHNNKLVGFIKNLFKRRRNK